jgi:putative DNA methylase
MALTTFSDLVREVRNRVRQDAAGGGVLRDDLALADGGAGAIAYSDAVVTYLGMAIDRSSDFWCSLCTWANQPKNELVAHTFTKQALPMVWDFAEANPFCAAGGNFEKNLDFVITQ